MRKALALMVLIVAPTLAFAQGFVHGTVVFANSGSSPVQQWTSLYDWTPINVPAGGGYVALIAAPEGTALAQPLGSYPPYSGFSPLFTSLASFLFANPGWNWVATTPILPTAAGQFNGGIVDIAHIGVPGGNVEYCVIGWTGPYTTYDAAYAAALAGPGISFFGMSAVATTATGDPTTTPPGTPVNLSDTFRGFTLEGMYLTPAAVGSLRVTIVPACVASAGAQWSVDGGTPQPSGATVGPLVVGSFTVRFSNIAGWITPSNQTVGINFNATTTVIGTYVPNPRPFTYTTDNNSVTITGYTGPGGAVAIPDTIECLPVTGIGSSAFYACSNLTSVRIPNSVTNLGDRAFTWCTSLTNITIPSSVANIGDSAFSDCTHLAGVYFQGNAPSLGGTNVFGGDQNAIVYYLPGTTGWGTRFGGRPTVLWNPKPQDIGVQTNELEFTITGTTDIPIVVEASTNLANAGWTDLQSCTLTNGSIYFTDQQWTNYPARFYRIRSP